MFELPVHRNPSIGGMATDNKVASETSLQLLMLAIKCDNAMTGPSKFSVSLIILHLFSGVVDLIRSHWAFCVQSARKSSAHVTEISPAHHQAVPGRLFGGGWKNSKEENGTCPEKRREIILGSTVCVRSPACWRRGWAFDRKSTRLNSRPLV